MSELLDRRLFLRGLMLTSAGLIVPKPSLFALPAWEEEGWTPYGLEYITKINRTTIFPFGCDQRAVEQFNTFAETAGPVYVTSVEEWVAEARRQKGR